MLVKIYVNPNNPKEIKDTYNTNIFIFFKYSYISFNHSFGKRI